MWLPISLDGFQGGANCRGWRRVERFGLVLRRDGGCRGDRGQMGRLDYRLGGGYECWCGQRRGRCALPGKVC